MLEVIAPEVVASKIRELTASFIMDALDEHGKIQVERTDAGHINIMAYPHIDEINIEFHLDLDE